MKIKNLAITAALGFAGVLSVPSFAATVTADLLVSATVLNSCTVETTPMAFGSLDTSQTTNETVAGTITVLCTADHASATVTLGGGNNESTGQRRMLGVVLTTTFVPYNVFSDAGHTSAVAVDGTIFSGSLTALLPAIVSVYGQVPAGSFGADTYADTILVTLTY